MLTFTLYATHNAPLIMKGLANCFNKTQPFLIIKCVHRTEDEFCFEVFQHNLEKFMTTSDDPTFIDGLPALLTFEHLFNFVYRIKHTLNITNTQLCCDANLFHPGEPILSPKFMQLVDNLEPNALFPFSETPACLDLANDYIENLKIITERAFRGVAATPRHLARALQAELRTTDNLPAIQTAKLLAPIEEKRLPLSARTHTGSESEMTCASISEDTTQLSCMTFSVKLPPLAARSRTISSIDSLNDTIPSNTEPTPENSPPPVFTP